MNYDDIIKEMEEIQRRMLENFFKNIGLEELDEDDIGEWSIKKIDKPGVKGFVMSRSYTNLKNTSVSSREQENRNMQKMREAIRQDKRELLYDVMNEEDSVKIYIEVPGVEHLDVGITPVDGAIELEVNEFSTTIHLPDTSLNMDMMSKKHQNGVLMIRIPKDE